MCHAKYYYGCIPSVPRRMELFVHPKSDAGAWHCCGGWQRSTATTITAPRHCTAHTKPGSVWSGPLRRPHPDPPCPPRYPSLKMVPEHTPRSGRIAPHTCGSAACLVQFSLGHAVCCGAYRRRWGLADCAHHSQPSSPVLRSPRSARSHWIP